MNKRMTLGIRAEGLHYDRYFVIKSELKVVKQIKI
jgi:hypothetical protein